MDFFTEDEESRGPRVTEELITGAERKLGVRLPRAYLDLFLSATVEHQSDDASGLSR